jgi:uncharacterized membrane protein YkoI
MLRRGMLAVALVLGLGATGAGAHNHDRDLAEQLQAMGEVLPLPDVLARVARDYPGQVLKVEFEQENDHCDGARGKPEDCWIYELKILQDQGRLTKLKVDARTGETLWVGTRPLRHDGRHR